MKPKAVIKRTPEDFVVREIPLVAPDGEGEHLLVKLRKRNANTNWVAQRLAEWANVHPKSVSFAGMKDRRAVTEQWFSLHLAGRDADPSSFRAEGVEVLEWGRHSRKLKRGALRGNAFSVVLRDMDGGAEAAAVAARELATAGYPNHFGHQRFGRKGENLIRARRWFEGGPPPRGRQQRSLQISAARAALFNAVLDARVDDGTWCTCIAGDLAILDGTASRFAVSTVDNELRARVAAGDVHPSGPLWGAGGSLADGAVAELENRIAAGEPALRDGLARIAEADRRPLRAIPKAVAARVQEPDTLLLEFELPPGTYATSMLSALVDWREDDDA